MSEFFHDHRPILFQKGATNAKCEAAPGAFKCFGSGTLLRRQITVRDSFRNQDAQYSGPVESVAAVVGARDDLTSESVFQLSFKSGAVGKEMSRIGVKERREHECAEQIR